MLPALMAAMTNRTTWHALPAGTVLSATDVPLDAVQAWMEFLVIHANPFRYRPAPHFSQAQARVRLHAPPHDLAYVLVEGHPPRVTVRKGGRSDDAQSAREDEFVRVVTGGKPVSDKVTAHSFQTMYGWALTPARNKTMRKFLEIGLGCHMSYGAGASVRVWAELFPLAERWEAEFDEQCVRKMSEKLVGINVVTGDQGNRTTLARWINQTGGRFDMIVDDGGHYNDQVMVSFEELWPELNPGGLYVMEDLHVGRSVRYDTPYGKNYTNVPSDFVQSVAELLLTGNTSVKPTLATEISTSYTPPPVDAAWVLCQLQACMLGKRRHGAGAKLLSSNA
mmetsp:Transcript_15539/g.38997  ORF Transcript_15539/g.38997 Transcript_15539/m.38997 type:complete len:336 (-) Transcript_15539:119-1126(-)